MGQGIISRSNPGNSGDKVGDIKITTRNTLGEKWALCNGAYREDSDLKLDPTVASCWNSKITFSNEVADEYRNASYKNILYHNRKYYCILINLMQDTDEYYDITIYSLDIDTGVTAVNLKTSHYPSVRYGVVGTGIDNYHFHIAFEAGSYSIETVLFSINGSVNRGFSEVYSTPCPNMEPHPDYDYGSASPSFEMLGVAHGMPIFIYKTEGGVFFNDPSSSLRINNYIICYPSGKIFEENFVNYDGQQYNGYHLYDINGIPYIIRVCIDSENNSELNCATTSITGMFKINADFSKTNVSYKTANAEMIENSDILFRFDIRSYDYSILRMSETKFFILSNIRYILLDMEDFEEKFNKLHVVVSEDLGSASSIFDNMRFDKNKYNEFVYDNKLYISCDNTSYSVYSVEDLQNPIVDDNQSCPWAWYTIFCKDDIYKADHILSYAEDVCFFYNLSKGPLPTISVDDESYCFIKIKD